VIATSQGNDLLDASVRGLLAALKTVGEQAGSFDTRFTLLKTG